MLDYILILTKLTSDLIKDQQQKNKEVIIIKYKQQNNCNTYNKSKARNVSHNCETTNFLW